MGWHLDTPSEIILQASLRMHFDGGQGSFLTRGSGIEKQPVPSRHYYFPIQVASFSFSSGAICLIGGSLISWRADAGWCVGESLLNGGDCLGCCFQSRSPRFTELACVGLFALKPRRLANLLLPFLFGRKGSALRIGVGGNSGARPEKRLFGRIQPGNPFPLCFLQIYPHDRGTKMTK